MKLRKTIFVVYNWLTVILWILAIFWFSSIKDLEIYSNDYSALIERLTYMFSYGFLLILIFRAIISMFRLTVDRLSISKSKREAKEDKEFVIITETLILTNAILLSCLIAVANYHYLGTIDHRINDIYSFMTNVLGILLAALITYSWPFISIFEAKLFKLDD